MEIIDLLMTLLLLLMLLASIVIGFQVRKRTIPPFSTGYIMTSDEGKKRQRNDPDIISFISNVYYMVAIILFTSLLMLIFPHIKAFEYLMYVLTGIIIIYVFYKSIKYETHKNV